MTDHSEQIIWVPPTSVGSQEAVKGGIGFKFYGPSNASDRLLDTTTPGLHNTILALKVKPTSMNVLKITSYPC